jgi:hypothetical protein
MRLRQYVIKNYCVEKLQEKIETSKDPMRYARLWQFLEHIRRDLHETGIVIMPDLKDETKGIKIK